jgi:hypothetical protein
MYICIMFVYLTLSTVTLWIFPVKLFGNIERYLRHIFDSGVNLHADSSGSDAAFP